MTEAPYSLFPEDMSVIVLLHGTELVTVARKNEAKYEEVVQRMRYYAAQGTPQVPDKRHAIEDIR